MLNKNLGLSYKKTIINLPIVTLLLTNKCNNHCLSCNYWAQEKRVELNINDISKWKEDWINLGVQRILLSGGEPLLHSKIVEVCKILSESGFEITILTNGILLQYFAHKITEYCKKFIISLNGPEEIHNKICNDNNAYKKLSEGIESIKKHDETALFFGRCTVQKQNFKYLRVIVDTALKFKLNRISFLAADVSSYAFNREKDYCSEEYLKSIILDSDEIDILSKEIMLLSKEYDKLFEYGYISEDPNSLNDKLLNYYKALINQSDFAKIKCNAPWISTVVNFNGDVHPCFFQPSIGNLHNQQSLSNIISSEKNINRRNSFSMQDNLVCQRCVCPIYVTLKNK